VVFGVVGLWCERGVGVVVWAEEGPRRKRASGKGGEGAGGAERVGVWVVVGKPSKLVWGGARGKPEE